MPNFQNNKPFMTNNSEQEREIRPEYVAAALMREAVQNAKNTGNCIRKALVDKVGLYPWMLWIAERMDEDTLYTWERALRDGYLSGASVSLAQVEKLILIKRYISEELMLPPTEDETKKNQFKTTIETAVVRECDRPQKSFNKNFTPEKGSKHAPGYDGGDTTGLFSDPLQGNLWVIATEIVQWPSKKSVLKIDALKKLYRASMSKLSGLDAKTIKESKAIQEAPMSIPIKHLKYEVKDWVRFFKPSLEETYSRPSKERRNEIEYYKRQTIATLRQAVRDADSGRPRLLWKLAFEYLGHGARVELNDHSLEKRIEHQIRRKFNNKKVRVEGLTYLPPMAAGTLLRPMLDRRVNMLVEKNPKLDNGFPWAIKVYFEAEAREDTDGDVVVTNGVGLKLATIEDKRIRDEKAKNDI